MRNSAPNFKHLLNGAMPTTHGMSEGSVSGPVIIYTLPPEELERYRKMEIPEARNSNGKPIKKGAIVPCAR
jgi:hypothetical protein